MIVGVADSPNNPDEVVQLPAEGEDQPQILIPVSADDHARAKNRIRNRNLILAVLAVAAVAWTYKHYTDPIHADEALDAGERQLKSGQYQQAILSFDQAIGYRADYAEAFLERGRANMALSKPKDALVDFARYTAMRPQDPVGYIERGRSHMGREEFAAALEDGMLAVQNGPELGAAYQLRGVAYRRAGKLAEALADFDRAVSLAPEMANYFERGATYQDLGKHELAIEDFNEVIKFDGLNSQAYHARSKSYRALGNIKQADADHHQGRRLDGR